MKKIAIIIISIIGLAISSCKEDKPYSIYWQDNNLCVVMPHPTIGVIGINQEGWNGVDLADVVNDIFSEIKANSKSDTTIVLLRFETVLTDKYGNESKSSEDFKIAIIPTIEAPKYKANKFFDLNYHLTDNMRKAAFGNIGESAIIDLTKDDLPKTDLSIGYWPYGIGVMEPGDTLDATDLRRNCVNSEPIAPTDTLDF